MMNFTEVIAKLKEAQAEKERKDREAIERFKSSPEYKRLKAAIEEARVNNSTQTK